MKIILKEDWDAQVRPPTAKGWSRGYFAGRAKEIELLTNEIETSRSGAILVSGYRGVGKTSLTYMAIARVLARKRAKIVPVLLNAAQLEAESQGKDAISPGTPKKHIDPKSIIENLIRRLYSTSRDVSGLDGKTRNQIKTLYRKAVASEFRLIESYRKTRELLEETEEEEQRDVLLTEKIAKTLFFTVSWTIAVALMFGNVIPVDSANKLVSLLLAFPVPFGANLLYRKRRRKREIQERIGKAEELYQFDNSIGNLEYDLEQIHRGVSQHNKKLVYVIDELDKLNPEGVKEVLKFFKNLFTLSDALFIFVGGEDMFSIGMEKTDQEGSTGKWSRPKEYTYFTSRYFLSRPTWEDLNRYLESIVHTKESMKEHEFEVLKRALCFEAKNDFFDLRARIRDRIRDFDKGNRPIIEQDVAEEDIRRSRLHKSITILFESVYMSKKPTEWKDNEMLMREIFDHAHRIDLAFSGVQFDDPREDVVKASIVRDFNGFLHRLGAFAFMNETPVTIRGIEVPVRNYQYVGNMPQDPPDVMDEPTEIEKRYVSRFKEFCYYVSAINSAFRVASGQAEVEEGDFWADPSQYVQQITQWGFDAATQFNSHYPMFQKITNQKPPFPFRREEVE